MKHQYPKTEPGCSLLSAISCRQGRTRRPRLCCGVEMRAGKPCEYCLFVRESTIRTIPKCTMLALAGSPIDVVILVESGVLKLSVNLADGRTQIVGLRFRGDVVTTQTLGSRWLATVEVVEDATLYFLDQARINTLKAENPVVQSTWNAFAKRETEMTQDLLVTLGRRSPVERLAVFLHELEIRHCRKALNPHEIYIPISRDEIGQYLGMESETVSRQFTRLKNARCIELLSPSRVIVKDRQIMKHLIAGVKIPHL